MRPRVVVFSTRYPTAALVSCGQQPRKIPPPPSRTMRSPACVPPPPPKPWPGPPRRGAGAVAEFVPPAGALVPAPPPRPLPNPPPNPPPPPTNDTSSSMELGPAIQTTPAARGFRPPAPTLMELMILLPPRGALSTPIGSPSPANASGVPDREIVVEPGFNPINTVSGFSFNGLLTRYVPLGKKSAECSSMAACSAAVSSAAALVP